MTRFTITKLDEFDMVSGTISRIFINKYSERLKAMPIPVLFYECKLNKRVEYKPQKWHSLEYHIRYSCSMNRNRIYEEEKCYRLDHVRNGDIREEYRIFDLNDTLRICTILWKECIEIMSNSD